MTAAKNRIKGSMCICGVAGGANYDWFPVKMGVRGSTSVKDFTRKSYAIKVGKANSSASSKVAFLGMPKAKSWVLYAPEGDTAIVRNWLAYSLWRQTGRWGPRTEWAELFVIPSQTASLADPQAYYGLFMGSEKIWHGKHRIDITKYDASKGITGGIIFRNEHGKAKDVPQVLTLATSQVLLLDYPRKNVSDATLNYLTSYFNSFEKQLLAPGLGNYSDYVTPESLVDFFLAAEVIKSANDGYRGSTYFWKDADSACIVANTTTSRGPAVAAAAGPATEHPASTAVHPASSPAGTTTMPGNTTTAAESAADAVEDYCSAGRARVVMGPVWDAAKAMGLCCGFPVEGYQAGGASNGSSGGSAISPEGWLFNICAEPHRCKIDPLNGLAQVSRGRQRWQQQCSFSTAECLYSLHGAQSAAVVLTNT
uniref:Uncharacterized protein n=1 Tax=Tetradesmus obliquus TaxID=3088 RepID=A0A383WL78_TETOB